MRSDCYTLNEDFSITDNRPPGIRPCVVDLDAEFYGTIANFDERFALGVPSLLGCTSLTIEGDVAFGANVRCLGDVLVRNTSDAQATIVDNATLENTLSL